MAVCASVGEGIKSADQALTEWKKYNWSEQEARYFINNLCKAYEWYFADNLSKSQVFVPRVSDDRNNKSRIQSL